MSTTTHITELQPENHTSAPLFDFRDASLKGDPKWWKTSPRFAIHAPKIVLGLAVLSIVEIVLGVVWIVGIQSLGSGWGSLTFPQVIQPLIVPAMSFFNTIPSLHLHVLARSNNPILAMVFSSILSLVFLGSAIVFLPPCVGGNHPLPGSAFEKPGTASRINQYQRTECPSGNNRGIWGTMIALQFVSAIGYALHFAMALRVHRGISRRDRRIKSGDLVEMVDPVEKAKRDEEARRRWREMGNHGL